MKLKKILAVIAAGLISAQVFAAKDLVDSSSAGVMSKAGCVQTAGGTNICGGDNCLTWSGNTITSHSHACIRAGKVKVSDYSGAKAAAVKALLARH